METDLKEAVLRHMKYSLGVPWREKSKRDLFGALSLAVRDTIIDRMMDTEDRYRQGDVKRVYYLSLEFLMGRFLGNNLINLGMKELAGSILGDLGVDLEEILECEPDAALGNGGLGRLAACFLDSMATMDIPGFGCGINYEYGLFKQVIDGGRQKEKPDNWKALGTPWQLERLDEARIVPVYGRVMDGEDRDGNYNPMWMEWKVLVGVPHDMPVVGYGGKTVNRLRLYSARSSDDFDMDIFNEGDYIRAVGQKISSETVSKVLYPMDDSPAGQELRLLQEYFFTACAMGDIVSGFKKNHKDITDLPKYVAVQLNDTHPALAVAELMRILVDEEAVVWDTAWEITGKVLAYTNHTLLPEALETWPVTLVEKLVPRHMQIIFEINHRFLDDVKLRYPGDVEFIKRVSIIGEQSPKQVRMAHLAMVGSGSVNGVARLHTKLLKETLVPDFHKLWPGKFNNKTNGVTPRRWLLKSNPGLASLVTSAIGDGWVKDAQKLRLLEDMAEDKGFCEKFLRVKYENKAKLSGIIWEDSRVRVNPESLFSIHAKRIHEYKRQLLNALLILHQYLNLKDGGVVSAIPRTYIFAGKAAPGYRTAKQIIRFIHLVADLVNQDPWSREWMRVAFIPDYRVSLAENIIPAADLSEQISTAGKEASGTGNMKFALNGALTIGTMDGANVEILEEVGKENIFIFGHLAEDIDRMRADRSYDPLSIYYSNENVKRVLDVLRSGSIFPAGDEGLVKEIFNSLINPDDDYFHLADMASYIDTQNHATQIYLQQDDWAKRAILNVARMGKFSSDRTISEYASQIWKIV